MGASTSEGNRPGKAGGASLDHIVVESILAGLPVGLAVIGPSGDIVFTNPALADILGFPGSLLENKGWGQVLFHTEKNVEFNQVLIDVIQEEPVELTREVSYLRPDGRSLRLSITSSFLRENGAVAGIVVILHDVTESYALHAMEKRVLRERSRIEAQRAKGLDKLALSVAHQIRNPVTSIGGFASLAFKKAGEDEALKDYLETIRDEAVRLERIVEGVSRFAKLSSIKPATSDIAGAVRTALSRLKDHAASEGVSYELVSRLAPCHAKHDTEQLAQGLFEILKNALEWPGKDGVHIEVGMECRQSSLRIEIRDRGPGIAKQELPFVFDPFYTTKSVGVGMGLVLAKRIVEEAGGGIAVKRRRGKGTRVMVSLPRSAPPSAAADLEAVM